MLHGRAELEKQHNKEGLNKIPITDFKNFRTGGIADCTCKVLTHLNRKG
jgi:hypothetical protein